MPVDLIVPAIDVDEAMLPPVPGWRRALRALRRSRSAIGGAVVLAFVIGVAIFAPAIAPYNPYQQVPWEARKPPMTVTVTTKRLVVLGTDQLGRDVLSRIVYAARVTLLVALTAVLLSGFIGVVIGVVSGYFGGWIDALCMRFVDITLAFPFELFALSVVAVTGPGLIVVLVIMAMRIWVVYARVVRGATLVVKERDFIRAAVAQGAGEFRILLRHVLPNVLTPAVVIATLYVGRMILIESALSFLGVGVPPPTPTWGGILGDGRAYVDTAWWIAFFPGLAIMITVLAVNLLGDWVRDYLDPKVAT
jgi:peptide/nickel transport system permease protein